MSRTVPAAVDFGHVALLTADLGRFCRFYEDVVGLRTVSVEHRDGAWYRRVAALTDSRATAVRLLAFEVPGYCASLPDDVIGRRGRLDHVALMTAHRAGFDALVDRLVEVGASSGRVSEDGPMCSVLFVDPDGAHHQLQTANPRWAPGRTTEIVDEALWRRISSSVH